MLDLKQVQKESSKGLEIKEIYRSSPEGQRLMKEIYKQRFSAYSSLGWIPFSKWNSCMVRDKFDESKNTVHFAMLENGKVIGSQRSTKYSEEEKLPCYKDGYTIELFKTTNMSISELTRLVLNQDRKYPGCVLQLLYHVLDFTVNNLSEIVCSIAIESSKDLFKYIGTREVNTKIGCIIDKEGEKMLVINGVPMVSDKATLNHNLPLDKYNFDRTFAIIN
jgi:hypothetical protein